MHSTANTVLTRHNTRTDTPYHVWCEVVLIGPEQHQTMTDPGYSAEYEITAWGSHGQPIELTLDEEAEAVIQYEDDNNDIH